MFILKALLFIEFKLFLNSSYILLAPHSGPSYFYSEMISGPRNRPKMMISGPRKLHYDSADFWPQKSSFWDDFWPQKSSLWPREPLWLHAQMLIARELALQLGRHRTIWGNFITRKFFKPFTFEERKRPDDWNEGRAWRKILRLSKLFIINQIHSWIKYLVQIEQSK